MSLGVVWLKRDLRLVDHAPLVSAALRGPLLCVYIVEPSLWAAPDAARQHYGFLLESLRDLYRALRELGGRLHVITGEAVDVFERLHQAQPFDTLYSHEETGNWPSFQRDIAVGRWCRSRGVQWQEFPQFGVVRRLADRNTWHKHWEAFVAQPCLPPPQSISFAQLPWPDAPPPGADALGLPPIEPPHRQLGGRGAGLAVLNAFLHERSGQYRGGISSPLSAPTACSRLSPYLALGCLGLREVVQATRRQLADLPPEADRRRAGLTAFLSRLHWHCHFIQKLESEPELEFRNLHRGYDGLRPTPGDDSGWNPAHLDALVSGRTGWPLVDACVAMLADTGWLNFRMRAMLVSVASYPLWLHWRPVGEWLARAFIDYEPGIHWSQMQMQAGTTGINTTRVYNPIKQARDHDPKGRFVRHWLPAMARVPDAWLFEPWRMPPDIQARCGVQVGVDIPAPLVELEAATREAKARVHALRAQPEVRAAKAAIVAKHGSRRRPDAPRRNKRPPAAQLALDL